MRAFPLLSRPPLRRGAAALALAAVALAGALPAGAASFRVSPTRFTFSLDERFTEFFTVTNTAGEPVRIRIYPRFVKLDERNRMTEVEGHPYDLSRYVVINPRRISLRPEQRRVIRFSVRPPPHPEPGEYRTVIFFEELPPPPAERQPAREEGEQVELQLRLLTRLGVPLYGMAGERRVDARYAGGEARVEPDAVVFEGTLVNQGNAHLPLDVELRMVDANRTEVAAHQGRIVVQRGQRLIWSHRLPRPGPGRYVVLFTATNEDLQVVEATYTVDVTAPAGG